MRCAGCISRLLLSVIPVTQPSLSLVVAVYNKPEALRFVLEGCARQSLRDFEVIVADDGSGDEVRGVIADAREAHDYPLVHLWHPDEGWRKNVMLNNGIRASRAGHIVFIDGDCIPSRHFLRDHWRERKTGHVLLGRRVETSDRWTKNLTLDDVRSGRFERIGWRELSDGLAGRSLRVEDGIRIPSSILRGLLLRSVTGMLGSNFSASKDDLIAVNGFDELYDGPGCGEDSDIQYRLSLLGVEGKSMRNLAIQYHLYHPATPVSAKCLERLRQIRETSGPRCAHGLVHEDGP